jgi:hypothetical protein
MDGMVDMYGGISWRSAPSNFERHCRIPGGFHFSTHVSQGPSARPLLREELTFSHMIDSEPFPTMITSLLRPAEDRMLADLRFSSIESWLTVRQCPIGKWT